MSTPRCLELASYLTNEWSMSFEVCEDMDITRDRLRRLASESRILGIGVDMEDGKIRLSLDTTIDQVRFALG